MKVEPAIYAILYLLAIPLYALLYSIIPYQFYHSTIKYEASLKKDEQVISQMIRQDVIKVFKQVTGSEFLRFNRKEYQVSIDDITVSNLSVKDDGYTEVDISLYGGRIIRTKNNDIDEFPDYPLFIYLVRFKTEVEYDFKTDLLIGYTFKSIKVIDKTIDNKNANSSARMQAHEVFPWGQCSDDYRQPTEQAQFSCDFSEPGPRKLYLPMSSVLQNKLSEYNLGLQGFPSALTDNYLRMLYFSSVTITTLGYGDIVPITNIARLLVASETVIGVVIAGLFINALFSSRAGLAR